MKASEFNLRGINAGNSIQVEDGQNVYTVLVTGKKSGFGSGKKTVYTGTIKKDGEQIATFENADILVIKKLMGIKTSNNGNGGKGKNKYEKIARTLSVLVQEFEDDEEILNLLKEAKDIATAEDERIKKEAEAEAEAEKARKATAAALLKGGLTAEQLAQIQAILDAK